MNAQTQRIRETLSRHETLTVARGRIPGQIVFCRRAGPLRVSSHTAPAGMTARLGLSPLVGVETAIFCRHGLLTI